MVRDNEGVCYYCLFNFAVQYGIKGAQKKNWEG